MEKLRLAAIAIIASLAAFCVNANTVIPMKANVTTNVDIKPFSSLGVATGIKVTYTPGSKCSMKVTTKVSLEGARVEVVESAGELNLMIVRPNSSDNINFSGPMAVVELTAPMAKEISTRSGSSVEVTGNPSRNGDMNLESTSGSSISIPGNLTCNELEMTATSGSSMKIGNIKTAKLETSATSGASIHITAADVRGEAEVESTSGATIKVAGLIAPEIEAISTSGSRMEISRFKCSRLEAAATSAAHISINGSSQSADIEATSGAKFNITDIKTSNIEIIATSTGNVSVKGTAKIVSTETSSGGKIDIHGLKSDIVSSKDNNRR